MIILDENIDSFARERLRLVKIRYRHLGTYIGRSGMKDLNDVIPLLHSLKLPTFFTRDKDFYSTPLAHAGYCLVYLDVLPGESADYIIRFLNHNLFRRRVDRMGKVVRVHRTAIRYHQLNSRLEHRVRW